MTVSLIRLQDWPETLVQTSLLSVLLLRSHPSDVKDQGSPPRLTESRRLATCCCCGRRGAVGAKAGEGACSRPGMHQRAGAREPRGGRRRHGAWSGLHRTAVSEPGDMGWLRSHAEDCRKKQGSAVLEQSPVKDDAACMVALKLYADTGQA